MNCLCAKMGAEAVSLKTIRCKYPPTGQYHLVLIDDEDWEKVSRYSWHLDKFYAVRTAIYISAGVRDNTFLHRFIMNMKKGDQMTVDHIDGNKLNNQKENLRICYHHQNRANSALRADSTSGYKGVTFLPGYNKYMASISYLSKNIHLGVFTKIEDAATAYNQAALKYYGEFARLNIIEPKE